MLLARVPDWLVVKTQVLKNFQQIWNKIFGQPAARALVNSLRVPEYCCLAKLELGRVHWETGETRAFSQSKLLCLKDAIGKQSELDPPPRFKSGSKIGRQNIL